MAVVVSVQGLSGSGKTTLIEQLIPRLTQRGMAVGLVKHAHKGVEVDRPGKDSQRCWEAGAQAVLVASPQELFVRQRTVASTLRHLLSCLPQHLDCVLVEGFTHTPETIDVPVAVRIDVLTNGIRIDGAAVDGPVVDAAEAAILNHTSHARH